MIAVGVFHERITLRSVIGTCCVLFGTFMYSMVRNREMDRGKKDSPKLAPCRNVEDIESLPLLKRVCSVCCNERAGGTNSRIGVDACYRQTRHRRQEMKKELKIYDEEGKQKLHCKMSNRWRKQVRVLLKGYVPSKKGRYRTRRLGREGLSLLENWSDSVR